MTQPTYKGRKLPLNDWEGDDFTPGAGGRYVTCMDTAAGRMVAWATNGRVDKDGRTYRAAVRPPDPNGITMDQAAQAVQSVAHLPLMRPSDFGERQVKFWLRQGRGLMMSGIYDTIPRAYRHQRGGDFAHELFVSHMNYRGTAIRLYDPLNPDTDAYGRHVPSEILWPFLRSLAFHPGGAFRVCYVPLQPLIIQPR